MRTGEIFDLALRCYQRLGWTYLKLTLVPALFCFAAHLFDTQVLAPSLFVTSNAGNLGVQLGEVITAIALGMFVGGPLFMLGLSWSTCVVAQLVSDTIVGNVPSPAASVAAARRSVFRVFAVNLYQTLIASTGLLVSAGLLIASGYLTKMTGNDTAVAGVVALVGTLGLVAGGIIFLVVSCRYALAPSIAVIENARVRTCVKRSVMLQSSLGYHPSGTGSVFGLMLLCGLFWLLFVGGVSTALSLSGAHHFLTNAFTNLPLGGLLLKALELAPAFLGVWTIIPFWATALTILYYERRVRLEGYDIEALAADVWRTDLQARFEL